MLQGTLTSWLSDTFTCLIFGNNRRTSGNSVNSFSAKSMSSRQTHSAISGGYIMSISEKRQVYFHKVITYPSLKLKYWIGLTIRLKEKAFNELWPVQIE